MLHASAPEEEVLQIKSLLIEPNDCPLHAPLSITMEYSLRQTIPNAFWDITYEADFANKKHTIPIASSAPTASLQAGNHTFHHSVPTINTSAIKEKHLLQMGLVKLTLKSMQVQEGGLATAAVGVTSVNLMVQVTKDATSGTLMRSILSPLE